MSDAQHYLLNPDRVELPSSPSQSRITVCYGFMSLVQISFLMKLFGQKHYKRDCPNPGIAPGKPVRSPISEHGFERRQGELPCGVSKKDGQYFRYYHYSYPRIVIFGWCLDFFVVSPIIDSNFVISNIIL